MCDFDEEMASTANSARSGHINFDTCQWTTGDEKAHK